MRNKEDRSSSWNQEVLRKRVTYPQASRLRIIISYKPLSEEEIATVSRKLSQTLAKRSRDTAASGLIITTQGEESGP